MALKAGDAYYEVHANTKGAENELNSFEDKVQGGGKGFSALHEIGVGALRKIGEAFVSAAGKAVEFGASVIQVGQGFEAQMDKVSAIAGKVSDDDIQGIIDKANEMGLAFKEGADSTATAANILSAKAEEMGAKTKFTAEEAGQGFEYMAMAGWKTEQMLEGIEPILNLATAAGEDLGTTSDIVTDALTAFGLQAEDTGHFADVLAAASSNANTNVSMMGETFKFAAPIAGAMGYSIEDTAEAIGILANSGIKGSQAGTTLRQVMSKLNGEVKISGKAIGDVTIKTTNADGSMRDFTDILDDCRKTFSKLSDSEKVNAAQTLVGKNAMSGFLSLMNAAPEDVNKLRDAIKDCDGATQTMADTMNDNLQGQITILNSALDGLRLTLYKSFEEPLTDLARDAQGWVNQITEGFKEGGIEGMFEAAGEIIDSLIEGFLEKWSDIAASGFDMLTNFIEGFLSGVPEMVGRLVEFIGPLVEGIVALLPELGKAGMDMLVALANGFVESFSEMLAKIPELVSEMVGAIAENLYNFIASGWEIIKTLASGIWDNRHEILQTVWDTITGMVEKIFEHDWLGTGIQIIKDIISGLWKVAGDIWEDIKSIGKTAGEWISNIDWAQVGQDIVTFILNGIKFLFFDIPKKLAEIGSEAIESVKNIDWWGLGKSLIDGIVNGIKAAPGAIADAVMGLAKGAWNGVKSFFGIRSPSRLMRDTIGQPIGEGMALGIEDTEGDVEDAMLGLSDAVYSTALDANVNYNLPDITDMAKDLGATFTSVGSSEITVPLYLDGREIARGTAYYMGQQLAWEG